MKWIPLQRIFIVTVCFSLIACSTHKPLAQLDKASPYANFTMLDGSQHALSEWLGKPIVILFWSVECNQCEAAIAELNESTTSLRHMTDMIFIAASVDLNSDFSAVRDRIKTTDFNWFIHAFSGNGGADEAFQLFNGESTPFFVLINRNGQIAYTGSSVRKAVDFISRQKIRT